MKMIALYAAGWFGMVPIAMLNGTIREKWYGRFMGELSAHQLSTVIAMVLFGAYIRALTGWWPITSPAQALAIGGIWLMLTVGFEFLFGRLVMGHSWRKLAYDYNLMAGRLWILLLAWTAAAPYVFYRLRA